MISNLITMTQLGPKGKTVNFNQLNKMLLKTNNNIYFISYIEQPHKIWYPINLNIAQYGEDYIKQKFGITNPDMARLLQEEFEHFRDSYTESMEDYFDHHVLRFDKTDYPFYTIDQVNDSVVVFMEKGLFSLGPDRPGGYPWAYIEKSDTPEQIQVKLFDDRRKFGVALQKKLKKIMGW